jgi:selenocysteine lyase/cysteine desulfurase
MTHVCFRNGVKLDVEGVARLAHAKGAKILLDCYQSVGTELIDARALDIDFAIGGMLKYLLGTAGVGFLYVRDTLISGLTPTNSGWFAQADIMAMDITANHPSLTARRFEAGTPPVVNCYAAEAGLAIVNAIGLEAIEGRVRALTRRTLERLQAIGWPAVTPSEDAQRGPMVAIPSREAGALVAALIERDIVGSYRDNNLRLGFHFYNNESDIEAVVAALVELRPTFGPN